MPTTPCRSLASRFTLSRALPKLIPLCAAVLMLPATAAEGFLSTGTPSALAEIRQRAAKHDAYYSGVLGQAQLFGAGLPINLAEAHKLILAAQSNPLGRFYRCEAYRDGFGLPGDDFEALDLCRQNLPALQRLADEGDVNALYALGYMYYTGTGIDEDKPQALFLLSKAAEAGHLIAMGYVGLIYDEAQSVEEDDEVAVDWYQRSAEAGYAVSQFNLGLMYRDGTGVPQSDSRAMDWFQRSAERGYNDAQYTLGMTYRYGRGVEVDLDQAFKWFSLAAQTRNAEAQLELGQMYRDGLGTDKDLAQARQWLEQAARNGSGAAKEALESLEESNKLPGGMQNI